VGQVVSGMDVVDKIKKGSKQDNGTVTGPDKIVKMQIAPMLPQPRNNSPQGYAGKRPRF